MNRTEQIAALRDAATQYTERAARHQAHATAGGYYIEPETETLWIDAAVCQSCADAADYVASVLRCELDALELEDAAEKYGTPCPPAAQLLAAAGHYNDEIPF